MAGKKAFQLLTGLFLLVGFVFEAANSRPASGRGQVTDNPNPPQDETSAIPSADFRAALKAAEANLATRKGQAYEKKMRQSAGEWLPSEVARCTKEFGGTAFGPFTVLLRVGKSGKAEEVLAWPETYIADCLKPKFVAADFPKPPHASWWFKMDIRIEFKEQEGSGEAPADAQFSAGLVYGGEHGVGFSAPEGWVLDNKSGVSFGTHAVIYPRGSSWRNAPEVMYINVNELASGDTFEKLIAKDVDSFKKEFLGIKIEELEPIVLRHGGKALVRSYSGGTYASYECVAYAQYGTGAAMYVLTCRSQAGLEKTVSLFRDMVARSYPVKIKFEGKTPIVTLIEPESPVKSAEDLATGQSGGPKDAEAAQPLWRQGGYSYWSRFKPGAYVTFRYSLRSAASDQDMLKTITLKDVTPNSVALEYQESPRVPPKESPAAGLKAIYQRSRFDFRAVDEDFQKKDLFGGELSLSPADILEDSDREKVGEGVEDIDWKGVKLPTAWKRIQFGGPFNRTNITIWLSDEVPGTVARMIRELYGDASFTEEFVIDDFKASRAEPAEIERLRAARKPALVEISASSYVESRFRFLDSMDKAFHEFKDFYSPSRIDAGIDWLDWMTTYSRSLTKFRELQAQLGEDEKKAAAELGSEEMAKLQPLLEQMDRVAGLNVKWAQSIVDFLSQHAASPPDAGLFAALEQEAGKIMGEVKSAHDKYFEEFKKAEGLLIGFIKKPG